jgi:muramoyltetrapeptide carboxypeptidase LdcA involved in peptidoglycan recycling
LTLAGYWERCEGILLGDFHEGDRDLRGAVLESLDRQLPRNRSVPVLVTDEVGHTWPMKPLPLHTAVAIERSDNDVFSIRWDVRESDRASTP